MPARALLRAALLLPFALLLPACGLWPFGEDDGAADGAPAARPTIPLDVSGVDGRLAENVRAHVTVASKPCDTAPAYVRGLAADAPEEARRALRAYGYYAATATTEVHADNGCPRVAIAIERGPRVRLRNVDVRVTGPGGDDSAFSRALAGVPLASGDALSHARYATAKSLIETLALERGYLDGRFSAARLAVDPDAALADVTLVFASGPRYRLGKLHIEQQPDRLNERLVRRFLDHEPGRPYNSAIVQRYYSALSTSEYFQGVEVRPLLSQPSGEDIPLEVTLTPRKQHKYSAGIGASTDEGIRGRFNYLNRRVNRRGHRLSAELRASLIEQRLATAYQIPREHPADEWLSIQAGVRREDLDTFDTIESRLGVSETKRR
ncbi:MAG: POTRA domain-containing protein, partial [Gammaproteobacteria bacterium]